MNVVGKILTTTSAIAGAYILFAGQAVANETITQNQLTPSTETNTEELLDQIDDYNSGDSSVDQVTNVDQFRDVSPGDWAYEALANLVNRYGCIVGYPDQTYRGNQALTRYEFAAGLNSCLNVIERLIVEGGGGVAAEDLEQIQRLVSEFEAELATLGARVDDLEGRVAFLEDNQFSTTTVLRGEVIFALTQAFGDTEALTSIESEGLDEDDFPDLDSQTTFSDRVRLNFESSFTGEDRLRVRLQAANVPNLNDVTGTDEARLGFDSNNDNNVEIDDLFYRFPLGSRLTVHVGASGLDLENVLNPTNPYFESSGSGAVSRFGRFDPLVFRGPEGAGAAVTVDFTDAISITGAYLADGDDASEPGEDQGFFNSSYSAAAQVVFQPTDRLEIAANYVHAYESSENINLASSTGTDFAQAPLLLTPTTSDRVGASASFQFSDSLNVGGWASYAWASAESDNIGIEEGDSAEVFNWAAHVALPDFGGEGNVLGFIVGQPPKVVESDVEDLENDDSTWHLEALYKYYVNDNILITPGIIVLLNPEANDDNDTIYVGVIRTTFEF